MKLHRTARFSTFLLAAGALVSSACLEIDDPEIGSTEQEGIFTQGIFTQGIFTQGIFTQGIFTQGTSPYGGAFDGTLMGSAFYGSMKHPKFGTLYSVRIDGSELVARTAAGWSIRGTALRGAEWRSNGLRFRIADVRRRPSHPDYDNTMVDQNMADNSDVWDYDIEYSPLQTLTRTIKTTTRTRVSASWSPVCNEGPFGERWANLIPGGWDGSRVHHDDGNVTIACSAGVAYKCQVNWGYKRWKKVTRYRKVPTWFGSVLQPYSIALADLHDACVYAASATLCETGYSHTNDGMTIDLYDVYGLNVETTSGAATLFNDESWYDASGAVMVNYERFMIYSEPPTGATIPIFEDLDRDGEADADPSCWRPQSLGAPPSSWTIAVRSDEQIWKPLDVDLDPNILDEEGPLGGGSGGGGVIQP